MPWLPEHFTAPALQELLDERRQERMAFVPYFDGLRVGDPAALVASFAGEPEIYDPIRGRIRGVREFEAYATDMAAWLTSHDVEIEDVARVSLDGRGFEEVVLRYDGVTLPYAIVADRPVDGRFSELRIYYSTVPLIGHDTTRPPLLQPDPEVRAASVVAEHELALAAADVDAIVATFLPDGFAQESDGAVHRGPEALKTYYTNLVTHGGGIALAPCAIHDAGTTCALEYNIVSTSGETPQPPQAGLTVHARATTHSDRLASVRIYGDAFRRSQPWNGA
jgi:hypothetical protein